METRERDNFKSTLRKARSLEKSACGEKFFWEERHLAAPFLLFFLANSKRWKRDRTRERDLIFITELDEIYEFQEGDAGTGTVFFQLRINANLRELFLGCGNAGTRENFSRRSRRLRRFYGRSGILPLHFCYFSPQTQSACGEKVFFWGGRGTRNTNNRGF